MSYLLKFRYLYLLILVVFCLSYNSSSAAFQYNINSINEQISKTQNNKLFFIKNSGEYVNAVKYYAKLNGLSFWLTNDNQFIYDIYKCSASSKSTNKNSYNVNGSAVQFSLLNANKNSQIEAVHIKSSNISVFKGNGKSQLFSTLLVRNVYDNIDLKFYFDNNSIRYDFILNPGADINNIKLKIDGADSIFVNSKNELAVKSGNVTFTNKNIFAYQSYNNSILPIKCRFHVYNNNLIGFQSSKYNKNQTLTIDPLVFSTYIGGSGIDRATDVKILNNSSIYVAGVTYSSNFPTLRGAYQSAIKASSDAFISKFNSTGDTLLASTFFGGNDLDYCSSINIDNSGHIFMTGWTSSTDFPVSANAYKRTIAGAQDCFIAKFDSNLTSLLASTLIGGSGYDYSNCIQSDNSGNPVIAGYTMSSNFPVDSSAFQKAMRGTQNSFISKFNADLSRLISSTYFGGSSSDYIYGLLVKNNNIYICGSTQSTNFPIVSPAYDTTYNGNMDCFISKLNPTCSTLLRSTYFGGSSYDIAYSLTADSLNNIIVAGNTSSTNFPVSSDAYRTSSAGNNDAFVLKLDSNLTNLAFSTLLGGGSDDYATSVNVDANDNIYIVGYTSSSNFPVTNHPIQQTRSGASDFYIAKFNSYGTNLLYSSYFGGTATETTPVSVLSADSSLIIAGITNSVDIPVSDRAFQRTEGGVDDAILFKINGISDSYPLITLSSIAGSPFCRGSQINVPFTVTGTFDNTNKFILQLSDAQGLFTNPKVLDSVTSITSGSIISHIPFDITPGTKYKFRIVSTAPVSNSNKCTNDITINDCTASKMVNVKLAMNALWNGTKHSFAVVAIELRKGSSLTSSTLADRKPAIVDSTGNVALDFNNLADGNYWIVVRTHGYLPLAATQQINLSTVTPAVYDFTTGIDKAVGGATVLILHQASNIWMLKTGDLNGDRRVNSADVNLYVLPSNGTDLRYSIPLP